MATRAKKYHLGNFVLDALLFVFTGGLWLIWMIIREAQIWKK